jgi:hypothetical protein
MSLLISEHREKIKGIIRGGGNSLYRVDENMEEKKAFAGLDFRRSEALTAQLYSRCPFVLRADISRFFYTAYTHSIPWAVIGKEKTKDWLANSRRRLTAHWSNELDSALQACQSRETFGIPVGPDTSRIVAEVLLAGVEADTNLNSLIRDRPRFRLLDDYFIGFDDEAAAQKALVALRSALWKFNLQLNDQKTSVANSRLAFKEKWKLEFDSIFISDVDVHQQESDVQRLLDLTLHFCSEAKTGAPAHWACRRLSNLRNVARNFGVILDALFRLSRDFPSCTNHVAAFLINHQTECHEPTIRKRVALWTKSMMTTHFQHAHDFELAWCLLVCGVLRLTVGKDDLAPAAARPSSVVFAMLGMLRERGLLSVPLSYWGWRAQFKKNGILGQNWLPFYEAVRRSWTTDNEIVSAVNGHPILAQMLAAKVTFLEDRVLDASRINIVRRVFAKGRRDVGKKAVTAKGRRRPFHAIHAEFEY